MMDRVKGVFKPRPTPQEQLREWQRRLRQEARNVERQVRDIQREEKNVQKSIREAVRRNDTGSAKFLAKEIVRSRKVIDRLYENRAQLNSISMHLGESVATAKAVGHLAKSAEVLKMVNNLMKAPEISRTMMELQKEMLKAGVIEEIVNDAVDSAIDTEDMEDEIDEEVDKVLSEVAGETISQLPATTKREKMKQPADAEAAPPQQQAVAEGDDEAELEALRARLADVRS
ncbi:vacuolar protein sorting-associated protein 24 homolog 1 isoform X1 [Selaginella moellendorffii]|uniref:vacuolar protein sorting-associated protein 24 homolog 1 isoform X1 n=1 Tax=Selaginella moellendorffii TaxID=88036 RepID=UPI000D1C7303|nr:vacuolar protein sorting-associated protein 24 homolog 1 isoform X1 [Selaginella moellendorffii]|eukprot:XP_024544917.1 vacuolar protein sorting-associated protein 24 homolog 1 isoform X1 [Selaginella moellendorffii]